MNYRQSTIGLLLIIGLILFGVSACGGDDKPEAGVAGSSRSEDNDQDQSDQSDDDNAQNADSPNTTPTADVATIVQELPGTIVYLQGETLMRLAADEHVEPRVVAEDVVTETLVYVPDHAAVIFESDRRLYVYDTNEDTITEIGQPRFASNGFIENWSPNREWFLYRIAGTTLVNIEGNGSYDLSILRIGNTYRWTTNNELLVIDDNGRQGDRFAYQQVNQINLGTGEPEPIDIDLEPVNNDELTIEGALNELGYEFIPIVAGQYPRIHRTNPATPSVICDNWSISDGNISYIEGFVAYDDTVTLYQSPPVYMLNQLTVLSDDELVFLKWTVDDCSTENPHAELIRYSVRTQAEQVLTDAVFSDRPPARDQLFFGDDGADPRYSLSPTGQFIVWIGGSIDGGVSSLNLLNLLDGSNTVLVEIFSDGNVSTFVNDELISEVYWIE